MKSIINKIKNLSVGQLYMILTVLCVAVFFICIYFSGGELLDDWFYGGTFPITDDRDVGMDFFNSIIYLKDNDPYVKYGTLYPPLANLFFKLLYHMVPKSISVTWEDSFFDVVDMRRTETDLRTYQPPMLLFIFFISFTVLMLAMLSSRFVCESHDPAKQWIPLCTILSYGVLYSFERGNIILISLIFTMIFLLWYQSPDRIRREIALISLAAAAGLKLYPALFGILLIQKKQYKEAGRAIVYGILSVVLPCFAFKGGLSNIPLWLDINLSYNGSSECLGISGLLSCFIRITDRFGLFITPSPTTAAFFSVLHGIVNPFILLLPILSIFHAEYAWERVLAIEILMILSFNQGTYVCCFFIIPLLLYMKEHSVGSETGISSVILVLMLFIIPVPLFGGAVRELCGVILFAVLYILLEIRTLTYPWKKIMLREKINSYIKRGT